ncbi:hypothetical protein D9M70_467480 [compost metagenome]
MYEVTALLSVFKQRQNQIAANARREDREDAGIRIVQRLAFAVDILEPVDYEADIQRLACDSHQVFLGVFGCSIYGRGLHAVVFTCGARGQLMATARAIVFPAMRFQCAGTATVRVDGIQPATVALICTFSIYRPAGSQHHALELWMSLLREDIE